MPRIDWSMTAVGYPAHRRNKSTVVGVSHMNVHAALRFAEQVGLYTGWLAVDDGQSHVDGFTGDRPSWVALAEIFVEGRIANTDGMVSGRTIFVAAVQADGAPPTDRSLVVWAEEIGRPWLEVIDNEAAYWGNLPTELVERLLCHFLCQRPLDLPWKESRLAQVASEVLRKGLFDHGWTRNLALVSNGRKPRVELWAGVHGRSILEHDALKTMSLHNLGVAVTRKGEEWVLEPIVRPCPLDDGSGRLVNAVGG